MSLNRRSSDWILNYVIMPILFILLIGVSTKIHFMSKSKIDGKNTKLTKIEKNLVRLPNLQ